MDTMMRVTGTKIGQLGGFAICLLVLWFFVVLPSSVVVADELLDLLEAEAKKVEPGSEKADEKDVEEEGAERENFEEMLRTRYHGSYTFYSKLPDRMQLEIFQDYEDGVDIDELRSKIITRYLQQN